MTSRQIDEMSLIVSLNNEAVSLLQQGQHIAALTKFRRALALFNQRTDKDEAYEVQQSDPEATIQEDSSYNSRDGSSLVMSVPIAHDMANDDFCISPHNIFIFYARAFLLSPRTSQSNISQFDLTLVLLFNMGLTCHHNGLVEGNKSSYFLNKALGLYRMIVPLRGDQQQQQAQQSQSQLNSNSPIRILLLALWSNMGHVYSHFFYAEEAAQCGEQLSYLLQLCYSTRDQQQGSDDFRRSLNED
jgi:tetratricopeptide (TPR) repeat protein